jgi:hypothetical protein
MTVSNDGTLHVLWYSAGKNGETGLYSSESKDGGNSFGPRTLIAAGEIHGTPVLINDGEGLAAVWETKGGKIMMTSLKGPGQRTPVAIADGALPAAVETPSNRLTAYISEDEHSQAIFITAILRAELHDKSQ